MNLCGNGIGAYMEDELHMVILFFPQQQPNSQVVSLDEYLQPYLHNSYQQQVLALYRFVTYQCLSALSGLIQGVSGNFLLREM